MSWFAQHPSYREAELIWRWNGEDVSQFEDFSRAFVGDAFTTSAKQIGFTVVDSLTGSPHKKLLRLQRLNDDSAGLNHVMFVLIKKDELPDFEDDTRRLIIEVNGDSWDQTGATGNRYICNFVIGDEYGPNPTDFAGYALTGLGQTFRVESGGVWGTGGGNWNYTQIESDLCQYMVEGRVGSPSDPFGDYPHFALTVTHTGRVDNEMPMLQLRNTYDASDGDWRVGSRPDTIGNPGQWSGNQFNRIGFGFHVLGRCPLHRDIQDIKIYRY